VLHVMLSDDSLVLVPAFGHGLIGGRFGEGRPRSAGLRDRDKTGAELTPEAVLSNALTGSVGSELARCGGNFWPASRALPPFCPGLPSHHVLSIT
jgi:hypothetical protein